MKHHLPAIFGLDVDCIVGGVESFLVDFADIREGDVEVVERFVFEGFDVHVVKGFVPVCRAEDDESFLVDGDEALHYCQDIDEQALTLEWFHFYLVLFDRGETDSAGQ